MSLAAAASRIFFDPEAFLAAFAKDPYTAIVTLRDSPTTYGLLRSYIGKIGISAGHQDLLSMARKAWKERDPKAKVRSTFAPPKPPARRPR